MNLVKTIDQYDNNNLFLCEAIKNNVMNDGSFIRILYSTQEFVLNGIYLLVELNDIMCEKYYNKYKCTFNIANNKYIVEKIKIIEEEILKKYKPDKYPCYKIFEQMRSGYIKYFSDIENTQHCSFILKISGIWETAQNYGLTYKFIKVN